MAGQPTVYYHQGGRNLGDTWAVLSFLLQESERRGEPVKLNRRSGGHDFSVLANEILPLLDSRGRVELVDDTPDGHTVPGEVWGEQAPLYVRTKRRWHLRPSFLMKLSKPLVCYQFDGRTMNHVKNPPEADLPKLTSWASWCTFQRMGKPMYIRDVVNALAGCNLFIGVCSGVAHIAHSVGCPVMLIQYQYDPRPWHGPHPYHLVHGTDHAIAVAKQILRQA